MGSGNWQTDVYTRSTQQKVRDHGTVFAHSQQAHRTGRFDIHEMLDPKYVNKNGANAGKITRESLDNDDHPESTAIAVIFDVTGSMGRIPMVLQQKLPKLHGLLMRKGYLAHPQILFGAVGDAYTDRAPLQISQFEADNRMDEHLSNILLEGGGGGQMMESYDLAAYFLARHTELDSLRKRGKRGYAFFIGDERCYPKASRQQIEEVVGDKIEEHVSTADLFRELQEKYEVFYLYAAQGSYSAEQIIEAPGGWKELLGERALVLEDADAVCETIALTVGIMEGAIDRDEGLGDLAEFGTDARTIQATGKALALVGASAGGGRSVATVEGTLPVLGGGSGAEVL